MLKAIICDEDRQRAGKLRRMLENDGRILPAKVVHSRKELNKALHKDPAGVDVLFLHLGQSEEAELPHEESPWPAAAVHIGLILAAYCTSDELAEGECIESSDKLAALMIWPFGQSTLSRCIVKIHSMNPQPRYMKIRSERKNWYLRMDSIVMLSSDRHSVTITGISKEFTVRSKLNDLYRQLPDYFWRCHQSFAVNSRYIDRASGSEIVLTNGLRASISTKYRPQILERLDKISMPLSYGEESADADHGTILEDGSK